MNPITVPKLADKFLEGFNKVLAAPNGDLTNPDIAPIEVKFTEEKEGHKVHTFWRPDNEELAALIKGAWVEVIQISDHLHPISVIVWGSNE